MGAVSVLEYPLLTSDAVQCERNMPCGVRSAGQTSPRNRSAKTAESLLPSRRRPSTPRRPSTAFSHLWGCRALMPRSSLQLRAIRSLAWEGRCRLRPTLRSASPSRRQVLCIRSSRFPCLAWTSRPSHRTIMRPSRFRSRRSRGGAWWRQSLLRSSSRWWPAWRFSWGSRTAR